MHCPDYNFCLKKARRLNVNWQFSLEFGALLPKPVLFLAPIEYAYAIAEVLEETN
jgi:hypothetical protein